MGEIRCRSRISANCYEGKEETLVYGKGGSQTEDGTWDGQTVVCDPCYIGIGQPSIPIEHPDAPAFGASIDQGDPRG